jgi:hypothetical protein
MTGLAERRFFERAVTVHRYDCEALSQPPQGADAAAREAPAIPQEAIAGYAVAARPIYDGIRRLIGHVAGLLILVQAGGRRDALDLPDLAAARERWDGIEDRLRVLHGPRGLEAHFARLEAGHAAIGEVLDDFDAARHRPDWRRHLDQAGARIPFAHACLQAASEPRAGMTPVDFNHACCGCAQRWRQEGGKNGSVFDLGA